MNPDNNNGKSIINPRISTPQYTRARVYYGC